MALLNFVRFAFAVGIVCGGMLVAPASAGESRPATGTVSTPITRQEVWQTVVAELRRQGFSDRDLPADGDLDLPAAVPAAVGRSLRVESACWDDGPRRTQFRLQCGEPGQCLPFLVYLREAYLRASAGALAGSCRMVTGARLALDSPAKVLTKPTIRTGDQATAVFISARVRMTASVTCMEQGREGEVIRVRGLDGHVFRARISGPAQLEALPQ